METVLRRAFYAGVIVIHVGAALMLLGFLMVGSVVMIGGGIVVYVLSAIQWLLLWRKQP